MLRWLDTKKDADPGEDQRPYKNARHLGGTAYVSQ